MDSPHLQFLRQLQVLRLEAPVLLLQFTHDLNVDGSPASTFHQAGQVRVFHRTSVVAVVGVMVMAVAVIAVVTVAAVVAVVVVVLLVEHLLAVELVLHIIGCQFVCYVQLKRLVELRYMSHVNTKSEVSTIAFLFFNTEPVGCFSPPFSRLMLFFIHWNQRFL